MDGFRKVISLIVSLFLVIAGLIVIFDHVDGYFYVMILLEYALLVYGIRQLIYYFTLARYKVGGLSVLFKGIIFLDMGLFAVGLIVLPQMFISIYLVGCLLLSGVIDILQAKTGRQLQYGHWKITFSFGLVKCLIALSCLFFLRSTTILSYIFAGGLFHSAFYRILTAFQKTEIVYVE